MVIRRLPASVAAVLSAVLILTLLIGCAPKAPAEALDWRLQSVYPPGSKLYDEFILYFVDEVAKRSDGNIKITPFPPGAIVKTTELLDSVAKGVVEMGVASGIYFAGKVPEAIIEMGLPFSYPFDADITYELMYEYQDGKWRDLINAAWHEKGVHALVHFVVTGYGLMTRDPVTNLDDLKGKKIRTFAHFTTLLKGVGVSTTGIAPAEQYMALKTGVIDGTLYPFYSLETYKFYEVCKTVVMPRVLGSIPLPVFVSLEEWNKLSPATQEILVKAARKAAVRYSKIAWEYEGEVLDKAREVYGVQTFTLPEEDVAKLEKVAAAIWKGVAGKTPRCDELVDVVKQFLEAKKIGYPGG